MKGCLFLLILNFVYWPCLAQLSASQKEFKNYIPQHWVLDTVVRGDLNKDRLTDMVLVLRNTDPAYFRQNDGLGMDSLDLNPRRLLILFRTGAAYKKELVTDVFLPSVNSEKSSCLEDPLSEGDVAIKGGVLKIRLHYWLSCGSWYVTDYNYTFRYQHEKFELIGLDVSSFHRASGESSITSYNFSTRRKQTITRINEFKENRVKPLEKWERIHHAGFFNLAEMSGETAVEEIINKNIQRRLAE